MGLSKPGYGIHGTNEPKSIGKASSHGCIRMAKKDLEEIYELVSVGDTVRLVGERNDETTLLFGPDPNHAAPGTTLAAAPQPVPTATTDAVPNVSAPAAATNGNNSQASAAAVSSIGTR
jgi:hypothetical protein